MADKVETPRRVKINKANNTVVIVVGITSFIAIFSIFASKTLVSLYFYQQRVSTKQQSALTTLASDNQAASKLITSYKNFVSQPINIIGGSANGNGPQDGPNGRIILDALPDAYDFPALATSIEKVLTLAGVDITGITGIDASSKTTQTSSSTVASTVPVVGASSAIPIPFSFAVTGTYLSDQVVITDLLSSIRPIQILSMNLSGSDASLTLQVSAQTFYQLGSGLTITSETIQ